MVNTLVGRDGIRVAEGYEYSETVADGLTSDPIRIPPIGRSGSAISLTLIAGAGTGRIEITTSTDANVEADTATWHTWQLGDITGTEILGVYTPITGVRCVSVSGSITFEIVI